MHEEYLEQLVQKLRNIKVSKKLGEGVDMLTSYEQALTELVSYILLIKKNKKQIFFIGNGGSSAIASHMTADFMKNGGMKTYSLYDNAVTTCIGNDYGYEYIFSKPISFLANEGDLIVAISSSGNSKSIVNAITTARQKKAKVITFSGFREDNTIKSMGDYNVYVPIEHYGIVESIHTVILQQIVDSIFERDGVTL